MSESVLKSILEESARLEWAKYENAPEHVFSKKHERKMKHSFKLFEKKSGRFVTHECAKSSHIRLTKKTVLVLLTILFLAVLAGGALFSFTSSNFRGRIYSDNTEIYAINTENCPATMEDPDILILDEPMNGLDKSGVEDMRRYLLDLKAKGKTILIASHSTEDIQILCECVFEMDKGTLSQIK